VGAHAELHDASVPAYRRACGFCSLQEWCWPPGMDECGLKHLHSIVHRTGSLPAGGHLFRACHPFTASNAVRRGCIKSYTLDLQGNELVRDFHLAGELLGFDAVYPERHHFNALVLKEASLCIIPYRDIAELSRRFPGLQTRILALMSRDFSRQQLCAEGCDAAQQVAIFLFDIAARLRRQMPVEYDFDLPVSRENIANYLRISPETLSRVMSKLQRAGLLSANRTHIRFLDVARLGLIATGAHLKDNSVLN